MTAGSNPFRAFEEQLDRMQRQFEEYTQLWGGGSGQPPMGAGSAMGIDLADRGDEFVLTADVPGFEIDDIEVRLTDDTVSIRADAETSHRSEDEVLIRSERTERSVSRSVRLPEPVDEDGVEASYNNGVLTITMPKVDPAVGAGELIEIE